VRGKSSSFEARRVDYGTWDSAAAPPAPQQKPADIFRQSKLSIAP